jgi:hypothetical protein
MDYVKPAEVVATMVDVGATKAQLPVRDLLIRGALSVPSSASPPASPSPRPSRPISP